LKNLPISSGPISSAIFPSDKFQFTFEPSLFSTFEPSPTG